MEIVAEIQGVIMMRRVAKQMESVSLVELKRLAEKLLPRTSALKMLILSEPIFCKEMWH
jgi:hypothetical protein